MDGQLSEADFKPPKLQGLPKVLTTKLLLETVIVAKANTLGMVKMLKMLQWKTTSKCRQAPTFI